MLEFATGPGFFKVEQDRALALVDDAVDARDRRRPRAGAARGGQAELERVEAGESEADRWQLEQRIRHAENQLAVATGGDEATSDRVSPAGRERWRSRGMPRILARLTCAEASASADECFRLRSSVPEAARQPLINDRPICYSEHPESFERQLGDRVNKRLKSPAVFRASFGEERDDEPDGTAQGTARQRIIVLDGSWGVLIQRQVRGEEAYRGERFRDHPRDVAGDPDLLNLTRPEVVLGIHRDYFSAGADIATTNTFTATRSGRPTTGSRSTPPR